MTNTTLKVNKELSDRLLIVSKLNGESKQKFTEMLLAKGIEPYWEKIKRDRFS